MNTQEINKASNKPNIQTIIQSMEQNNPELYNDIFMAMFNGIGRRETGLYYTPDNIAELISSIGQVYNPQSVIDICCGIGNIINSFQNVQTTKGIDINPNNIRLAKYINSAIDFIVADTTAYDFGNEKYDLVIGNLPWGARTADRKSLEIELIKKGLTLLNDNGIAIFVVPEGLLISSLSFEFRQEILSNFSLDMVISLSMGAFLPYTSIKTSILVLRNGERNKDVFMPEFQDNSLEIADNFKNHKGDFYLPISKITDRLDRNYYLSLDSIEKTLKGHNVKKLADIASIFSGKNIKAEYESHGKYLVFNQKDKYNNERFVNNIADENLILKSNDIVIGLVGENPKIYFYKAGDKPTVIKNDYAIIRPKKDETLSAYLNTEEGKYLLENQIRLQIKPNIGGATIPRLNISNLKDFLIPILSYQEIIDRFLSEKQNLINQINIFINKKEYACAKEYIEKYFKDSSESSEHKFVYLKFIDNAEQLELEIQEKETAQKQVEAKNKELNNLIAMFAHNFLGTLQCIRSNAEHENNAKIHLKTVNMMRGALKAFSIISADDDKLIEQLKQDNTGQISLLQNLTNNLALAVSQLLSKTNKDNIINLYLNYLQKTQQIEPETTGEELRFNNWEKWDSLQQKWEDEFNALFSENVDLLQLQNWLENNFFPIQINGFDNCNMRFKEFGITDSIFLVVFMETFVNALKYTDISQQQPLIITLYKQDQHYQLTCENPSAQESYRGTHKGTDFLKSIAKKINGDFITESTTHNFKSTFIIPAELLE